MSKYLKGGILMLVVAMIVFAPLGVGAITCKPDETPLVDPDSNTEICVKKNGDVSFNDTQQPQQSTDALGYIGEQLAKFVGWLLIQLSSVILVITGYFFDLVMQYTIVDMAENISNPDGLGGSISAAWGVLRDISNMVFIFVLLYAAFSAMFDFGFTSFGRTVMEIIIIALLINFSMFFTKIVIDASNVVSVGFYNSMVNTNTAVLPGHTTDTTKLNGISAGYMNMLGVTSWLSAGVLKGVSGASDIFILGIMQAIFLLITAVILLITAFMFVARFIILIFLMILSPAALICYIIPGQKSRFETWKSMLTNQAVFAPVFFALTWVVFKIGTTKNLIGGDVTGKLSDITTSPSGAVTMVLNYVIIIGFAVTALVVSKGIASKTAGFGAITGGAAGAVLGTTAWASRNVPGRIGRELANSNWLKNKAASGGKFARAGLWAADRAGSGSFDVRAIDTIKKIPGLGGEMGILGQSKGTGGFTKSIETRASKKADYAKRVYGAIAPGDAAEKEKLILEAEKQKVAEEESIRNRQNEEHRLAEIASKEKGKARKLHEENTLRAELAAMKDLKEKKIIAETNLLNARKSGNKKDISRYQSESDSYSKSMDFAKQTLDEKRKDMEENDTTYIELRDAAIEAKKIVDAKKKALKEKIKDSEYSTDVQEMIKEANEDRAKKRQRQHAENLKNGIFGWTATNKTAYSKISRQAKDETTEQKIARLAKLAAKEDADAAKVDTSTGGATSPTSAATTPKTP